MQALGRSLGRSRAPLITQPRRKVFDLAEGLAGTARCRMRVHGQRASAFQVKLFCAFLSPWPMLAKFFPPPPPWTSGPCLPTSLRVPERVGRPRRTRRRLMDTVGREHLAGEGDSGDIFGAALKEALECELRSSGISLEDLGPQLTTVVSANYWIGERLSTPRAGVLCLGGACPGDLQRAWDRKSDKSRPDIMTPACIRRWA